VSRRRPKISTNPYTSVTISGYNLNPPADDGSEIASNQLKWSKHKDKIGDPLKNLSESINTNVLAAFAKTINTDPDQNNAVAGSTALTSSELTIGGGSITVVRSHHTVDTESDASSDDLDTIVNTGTSAGAVIYLRAASTARAVTVRSGQDNIFLRGGNKGLSSVHSLVLMRIGTDWHEPGAKRQFTNMTKMKGVEKGSLSEGEVVDLKWHTTQGDAGEGQFEWQGSNTDIDDGGTIIQLTAGGDGRLVRKLPFPDEVTPQMFGVGTTDASRTTALNAALNWKDTAVFGSFTVRMPGTPDGTVTRYIITGTGARILEIQDGTRFIGSALEGTQIGVASGSTATALIEDDGSAAKIEIYNIVFTGLGNTSLTSGIRLGRRTTDWGVNGSMDNVTVRDMPNATAFDFKTNVIACGRLYSIDTKDGLINAAGAIDLHIADFQALGFSATGIQMVKGDHVDKMELEAPSSDDAKPVVLLEGGSYGSNLISIQAGRTIKTMIEVDPAAVGDFVLANTSLKFTGSGFFGDSASPAENGTASSGTSVSLTDTTKVWTRDQWKGAAVFITAGTGAGQAPAQIVSNTIDTIQVPSGFSPVPDATSVYALDYLIKKVGGGGIPFSRSMTQFDIATVSGTVVDLKTDTLIVGASNDAIAIVEILKVTAVLDFVSVAANSFEDLSVTVKGVLGSMPITLGLPIIIGDLIYQGFFASTDTVTVRCHNVSSGAINPGSQTFIIMAHVYA